jgi:hypothetical protein
VSGRAWRQRVDAGKEMADIAVAIDKFLDSGLPEDLIHVAKSRRLTIRESAQLKTLEKNLPIPGNENWVTLPKTILGIDEI